MNSRFQELAEQAGMYVDLDSKPWPKWMGAEECEVAYAKFAELIVKECAEICRRQQYYDADDEHKRGVNSGSYTCMNAIKQQFGVE